MTFTLIHNSPHVIQFLHLKHEKELWSSRQTMKVDSRERREKEEWKSDRQRET